MALKCDGVPTHGLRVWFQQVRSFVRVSQRVRQPPPIALHMDNGGCREFAFVIFYNVPNKVDIADDTIENVLNCVLLTWTSFDKSDNEQRNMYGSIAVKSVVSIVNVIPIDLTSSGILQSARYVG